MASLKRQLVVAAAALASLALIAAIGGGTWFYQRYYKPLVRPFVFLKVAEEADKSVRNATAFQAPASGEVTAEQWANYCDVEDAVDRAMGPSAATAVRERDALVGGGTPRTRPVPLTAALLALGRIGPVYTEAKRAQVAAMNRVNLSRQEFQWVRRRVFASSGLTLDELDLDGLKAAARDRRTDVDVKTTPADPKTAVSTPPQPARRAPAESWRARAFFGL